MAGTEGNTQENISWIDWLFTRIHYVAVEITKGFFFKGKKYKDEVKIKKKIKDKNVVYFPPHYWGRKSPDKQKRTHHIYQQKRKSLNNKLFHFPYMFCEPVLGMREQPLQTEWERRKKEINQFNKSQWGWKNY